MYSIHYVLRDTQLETIRRGRECRQSRGSAADHWPVPQISLSNPGAKTRQGMIGQYTCRSTIPEVKERTWLLLSVGTIESFEACEPSQETKAGVVGLSIAARVRALTLNFRAK